MKEEAGMGQMYQGIPREDIPWFPLIDPERCDHCLKCLEFCPYKVYEAVDGLQALSLLDRVQPDIILLDLNLPRLSGLDVLRRIRLEPTTQILPVVVLTSSKEEHDVVESYRLGANSYVRKPVDFVEFVEAARQLGLYWLVVNEPPPRVGSV